MHKRYCTFYRRVNNSKPVMPVKSSAGDSTAVRDEGVEHGVWQEMWAGWCCMWCSACRIWSQKEATNADVIRNTSTFKQNTVLAVGSVKLGADEPNL